jgi:FdrA protein
MIDYRLRTERIVKEAEDPQTAVILLDVLLGYGSHMDPASEFVPAIHRARTAAAAQGRSVALVGQICGTAADPQDLARQSRALTGRHAARRKQCAGGTARRCHRGRGCATARRTLK